MSIKAPTLTPQQAAAEGWDTDNFVVIKDSSNIEVHLDPVDWKRFRECGKKFSPALILEYALETLQGYEPDGELMSRYPVEQALNEAIADLNILPWFNWSNFLKRVHAAADYGDEDQETINIRSEYIAINAGVLGKEVYLGMPTQQLKELQPQHKIFADLRAYIDQLNATEMQSCKP